MNTAAPSDTPGQEDAAAPLRTRQELEQRLGGPARPTLDAGLQSWLHQEELARTLCILQDDAIVSTHESCPGTLLARQLVTRRHHGMEASVHRVSLRLVEELRQELGAAGRHQSPADSDAAHSPQEEAQERHSRIRGLLEEIVREAMERNASDIHIEKRERLSNIRFRIDGRLIHHDQLSNNDMDALCNLIFNVRAHRGSRQFTPNKPLHGSFHLLVENRPIPIRASTATELRGLELIMRLLVAAETPLQLENAGYTDLQLALLREAVSRPYGAIVMSGPTGSGKSTSLTALLEILDPSQKIISLEEPVERMLPHVSHIPVLSHVREHGWEQLLADMGRWDSNVNMLGEVRDQGSCDAIKKLVTSGKLTFTTLHASNALAIPGRLEELGLEPSMLYDPHFLICLVNQRLVPRLCSECKIPLAKAQLQREERRRWRQLLLGEAAAARSGGCPLCHGSGFRGRILVAEVILMDDAGRSCIRKRDPLEWQRQLRAQGWPSILDHAQNLLLAGVIAPRETERLVGPVQEQQEEQRQTVDYRAWEQTLAETEAAAFQAPPPGEERAGHGAR